jgi:flagellin-specific chaperone FliS
MIIAKEKRQTNIGEYLIYMYQIEDLIRACKLDKTTLEQLIISKYQVNGTNLSEIKNWYFGLAELMHDEQLQEHGHLSFITNKITELYDFHKYLLQNKDHVDYLAIYQKCLPILNEIMAKQKNAENEIQAIIDSIYAYFLLKLKKENLSNETTESIKQLGNLMAHLSDKFKKYEEGNLKIE